MRLGSRGRHVKAGNLRLMISSATGRIAIAVVCVLALGLALGFLVPGHASPKAATPRSAPVANIQSPHLEIPVTPKAPVLPPATVPPAAAPASVATAPPLAPREVFGFAPYWSLGQSAGFNVAGLTTLAYFSIGINANGTLNESGAGWNGYESQALSTLITRAHAAGKRVVLTVNDFDQSSLNALTSNPAAATTLAKALIGAIDAKNFDGVNLDLEGTGSADRAGLTALVTTVADTLHFVNPHWQVTMDTYASAAADTSGFYDISALAGVVDAFFVMEYSPNVAAPAQADSPLTSALFSDLSTAAQYAAAVPAGKVILGAPFFGIDWPTTGNTLNATATGAATTLDDSAITTSGHPLYWDPVTETAWTAYQVGAQWHESFFDDPTSLYQIAHLADQDGLRGVGVWALGMEGTDPAMVSALDGVAPAVSYAASPVAPSTTTTTAAPPVAAAAPAATTTTTSTTVPVASIVGTFEAESLAIIQGAAPSTTTPASQSVTLCVVATPSAPNAGCAAPLPPAAGGTTSTTASAGVTPPFPGATVVGLLSGVVVQNDASLSCLAGANQSTELGATSAVTTKPELVVWQWPGNAQYDYVVITTPSGSTSTGCANATLAFPVASKTSAVAS